MLTAVMQCVFRILPAVWVLLACLGGASAQDYEAGFKAFQAGNYAQARGIWRPLADAGDAQAQYGLGVMYERGAGAIAADLGRAAHWYARAVGQGHPSAQNNLGLMFAQGRGVQRAPVRATKLWQSAAEAGHLMAQYNLGLAYYRGEGLERDNKTALRWFRRAARSGLPDGQYAMGQMYRLGVVVAQDNAKALAWYRRAAAQGHGKAESLAQALADDGWEAAKLDVPATGDAKVEASPVVPKQQAVGRASPDGSVRSAERSSPAGSGTTGSGQGVRADAARIWLGSLRTRAKARQHWRDMLRRFPEALRGASPSYSEVDLGDNGTFYRVLAVGYPHPEAAGRACQTLRAREPSAFCKVMAGGN
ncbi:tetratricopeptide repeat protein [Ferruginivarius sediminum]|uniref:Sel1 repeat family protein n=1 Tax=Ferruginivarius sediminum TaxID=2661937 RepID=A0A369TEX6_9PROT|nr:tetratricopeptide repeat protein [Ferruginivarius sediminum]RDD63921.1 sel1 repeat family protein [Ferruginivarius sediminum]